MIKILRGYSEIGLLLLWLLLLLLHDMLLSHHLLLLRLRHNGVEILHFWSCRVGRVCGAHLAKINNV